MNNLRRNYQEQNSIANLSLDTSTLGSERPVLFAESDPRAVVEPHHETSHCHRVLSHPCHWATNPESHLYNILHARLFFLFADTICIFADDFKDFNSVLNLLKTWAAIGSASSLSIEVRPRVIIAASGHSVSPTFDVLEIEDLEFELDPVSSAVLQESFSAITLIRLADDCLSPLARHRRLKETIMRQADEVQQIRVKKRQLFSAIHMCKLYSQAVQHTVKTINQPFYFIVACREGNEISEDFDHHLVTFYRIGLQHSLSDHALTSSIASSVLMDSYPPDMHRAFFNESTVYIC